MKNYVKKFSLSILLLGFSLFVLSGCLGKKPGNPLPTMPVNPTEEVTSAAVGSKEDAGSDVEQTTSPDDVSKESSSELSNEDTLPVEEDTSVTDAETSEADSSNDESKSEEKTTAATEKQTQKQTDAQKPTGSSKPTDSAKPTETAKPTEAPTTAATTAAPTTAPPTEAPTTAPSGGYQGFAGKSYDEYDYYLKYFGFTEESLKKIDSVISQIISGGMNREQKIRAVHDYIVSNVTYDYTYTHYSVDDAMLRGTSVCQGYADSFYIFMTELGIPCQVITGTADNGLSSGGHAWNAVQLENGEWYFVDATWDDPQDNRTYDYYLITASKIGTNHFMEECRQNENTSVGQIGTLGTSDAYQQAASKSWLISSCGVGTDAFYEVTTIDDVRNAGSNAGTKGQKKVVLYFNSGSYTSDVYSAFYEGYSSTYHNGYSSNSTGYRNYIIIDIY